MYNEIAEFALLTHFYDEVSRMNALESSFVKSSTNYKDCPDDNRPEFAFIGRSNVGKSSLINMLTSRKKLAMVSSKPGKTQLINHFIINSKWYLVDLPGYGWAKVSKAKKKEWDKMINEYLLYRRNLACVFVLIDSRIEPKRKDIDFINWLGENGIPFVILFTKVDKQSKSKTESAIEEFKNVLGETWEEFPEMIITSALDQTGRDEILEFINRVITEMKN